VSKCDYRTEGICVGGDFRVYFMLYIRVALVHRVWKAPGIIRLKKKGFDKKDLNIFPLLTHHLRFHQMHNKKV
jgi:hypothetical protein